MTRKDKAAVAKRLREVGWTVQTIAEIFDVKPGTVRDWLNDPDRSKARKRRLRYSAPCVTCGRPTDGSGGYANQRRVCITCLSASLRKLSDDDLEQIHRLYVDERLSTYQISKRIGISKSTIYDALRSAGVTRPHRPGGVTKLPVDQIVQRYQDGESAEQLAHEFGVRPRSIMFQLRGAGVSIRSSAEAARLRWAR